MKEHFKKILTCLLIVLGIYILISGIKAGIGITRTYEGKIPIWFCVFPYLIGLYLIILALIAMHKNSNKKIDTILLSIFATIIIASGVAEIANIPKNYNSGIFTFCILPHIIELLITIITYIVIRKKKKNIKNQKEIIG